MVASADIDGPAVYDPTNRRLIVYGGGIGISGELVAYDLVNRVWTVLLEPAVLLEPRPGQTTPP